MSSMTVYIGTQASPQAWAVDVSAAAPTWTPALAVHRGLGGGTQAVWTGQPADAGQTIT